MTSTPTSVAPTPFKHARPHLTTHNRAQGHSSVAGAAYRLGLKLTDERTGETHDFRKRKAGEEIVRAVTVAPSGAPAWASDPQALWNRVEASEHRKDAQVARDYRVPIPIGLTDEQAGDLAEDIARYISDALLVPVSIGLHRDADRDALGNLKPNDKQGFHAHLFFPTRAVDMGQADGSAAGGSTGFGPKLSMLSNKRTSAEWVEQLNARWAELSNVYLAAANKPEVIDHRSYVRQGAVVIPQPKMGVAATAMERKGMTTARGDVLREALVMAEVQRRVQDATRTAIQAGRDVRVVSLANSVERTATAAVGAAKGRPAGAIPIVANPRIIMARPQRMVRTSAVQRETLAQKVAAAGPKPTNAAEQFALERAVALVNILEGFLQTAAAQMKEHANLAEQVRRAQSSALDVLHEIDRSRTARESARRVVRDLTALHPIRIRLADSGLPVRDPRQSKLALLARHDNHVQEGKKVVRTLKATEAQALREAKVAKAELDRRKASLQEAVVNLANENAGLLQQVLSFLPQDSAELVREAMKAAGAVEDELAGGTSLPQLDAGYQPAQPKPAAP
ncbi:MULTISPECIES: MobA/MobL family protein [Luteibacter]|uniref:MobA/MobL family protein n=1 Tax=Luteibacter TaxID=242605 RepID=UPI00055E3AE5|nr:MULTISPECIES: MobA/MobL family protein [unclassified Luteibacter]